MAISRISQSTLQNAFSKYNTIWDGRSAIGSMEAISSITLNAAQGSIEFNNIPQTYSHLQIRSISRITRAVAYASQCPITFNGDTTNYYRGHYINGDGVNATSGTFASGTPVGAWSFWSVGDSATASAFSVNIVDILDYTNTNKNKAIRCLYATELNATLGDLGLYSSSFTSRSAITSLKITTNSGNFMEYSSFTLYGVR